MEKNRRKFIIHDLMQSGFIEETNHEMILLESEESGKSELQVCLHSDKNLCIANVDMQKTGLLFFREGKELSMYKRVDHIIFERKQEDKWKLYLIEMKSSVGAKKWIEIKGKFRASYLLAQAIAGMLEITIAETVMYTTFEKVEFKPLDTMPSARRGALGVPKIRMEDEWGGTRFGLNFGERIPFLHIPIQMKRNRDGTLVGNLTEDHNWNKEKG